MKRIKEFYNKYISGINKYYLVVGFFVVYTLILGDSNLYIRYTYNEKIRSLEKEIDHYNAEIQVNKQKLEHLQTDKEGLERFAREEYLMKCPDEDLYIIIDK